MDQFIKTRSFDRCGIREDLFDIVYRFEPYRLSNLNLVERFAIMSAYRALHGRPYSPRAYGMWLDRFHYVDEWAKAVRDFAVWARTKVDEVTP